MFCCTTEATEERAGRKLKTRTMDGLEKEQGCVGAVNIQLNASDDSQPKNMAG